MASTIAAVTTSGGGVVTTADASGNLNLLAGTTTVVAMTNAGAAVSGTLSATGLISGSLDQVTGFKNRIINGAMVLDQRNAGASVTPTDGQYVLDRWKQLQSVASKYSVQQNAGSVTPPTGFSNYLGVTSLSSYSVGASDYFALIQEIEGFNSADLAFGTASASTVTISFWVRSSLTGTFGGTLGNSGGTRSYPFTYTISTANTWEQKTVTIAGDTSGTWIGATNGIGLRVKFGLGVGSTYNGTAGSWQASNLISATGATSVVGTNGATFYITGVQLEKGSTATSFDYRPYGTELALCQRYCVQYNASSGNSALGALAGLSSGSTNGLGSLIIPVVMRATPSLTIGSGNANVIFQATTNASSTSTTITVLSWYQNNISISLAGFTGLSDGLVGTLSIRNTLTVSSEL